MKELAAILDTWRGLDATHLDAVLATVVHVTGSAYRRPGARMLMVPDGRRIGCISGGCLEGEIARKAWWFTESGAPVVRVYDTTSEDDTVWEFGLGCNGVVHVLLERVNTHATSRLLRFLDLHRSARTPAVAATVIRTDGSSGIQPGDRLLLGDSSCCRDSGGSLAGSAIESQVLTHAAAVFREKRSRLAHIGATDVFVEWIGPPLSLVIFGAGHDAIPLVSFAAQLGWNVTVADARPAYAKPERFPGADCVVMLPSDQPLRKIAIDRETSVVVMTHNYPLDLSLLPLILPFRPRYLGLLGPRARGARLFSDMGLTQPACVHAPAGLDAGCDSPEAIALSIVAEIQADINSRAGGKLRYRHEPIHSAAYEAGDLATTRSVAAVRPSYCAVSVESYE
jgi:xanthine/CO dehydrogenase XdhC/CoxF family maturation factor